MKNSFITFVTGVCFGAATVTTIALLNALQSGKETRAQIRKEFVEARIQNEEAIEDAQTRTLKKVDEVKNLVKEIGDERRREPKSW